MTRKERQAERVPGGGISFAATAKMTAEELSQITEFGQESIPLKGKRCPLCDRRGHVAAECPDRAFPPSKLETFDQPTQEILVPPRMGAPIVHVDFDMQKAERILEGLSYGLTPKLAAQRGGISEGVLSDWRKRYPEFEERFQRSRGDSAFMLVKSIHDAAELGDWRAALALAKASHGLGVESDVFSGGAAAMRIREIVIRVPQSAGDAVSEGPDAPSLD